MNLKSTLKSESQCYLCEKQLGEQECKETWAVPLHTLQPAEADQFKIVICFECEEIINQTADMQMPGLTKEKLKVVMKEFLANGGVSDPVQTAHHAYLSWLDCGGDHEDHSLRDSYIDFLRCLAKPQYQSTKVNFIRFLAEEEKYTRLNRERMFLVARAWDCPIGQIKWLPAVNERDAGFITQAMLQAGGREVKKSGPLSDGTFDVWCSYRENDFCTRFDSEIRNVYRNGG